MLQAIVEAYKVAPGLFVFTGVFLVLCLLLLVYTGRLRGRLGGKNKYVALNETTNKGGSLVVEKKQIEFAYRYIFALEDTLEEYYKEGMNSPNVPGNVQVEMQKVLASLFKKAVDLILFNHLSSDRKFIELKEAELWNIILTDPSIADVFKTDQKRLKVEAQFEKLIEELVGIKEIYGAKEAETNVG